MGLMIKIIEIHGREILDSRGNPTVEGRGQQFGYDGEDVNAHV